VTGSTTIITGASGGMGRAIVERLLDDGHTLVLTDIGPGAWAQERPRCTYIEADVRDDELPRLLTDAAAASGADRWNLVLAAGISDPTGYIDMDPELWERTIEINLSSAYRIASAVGRAMRVRELGGAFVFVSSIAYLTGGANPAYGASKSGVNALVFGLAQTLGPDGIRVNSIAPGVIATPMVRGDQTQAEYELFERAVASQVPLRRLGTPQDIAGVVTFLVSDESAYVTGTVLRVTGGLELIPPFGQMVDRAKRQLAVE
jgi:3-oxoacyl-[acyl-carrier protein] reductase